jgi:putative ABC transport system permease protein
MKIISLTAWDLSLAALFVIAMSLVSLRMRLNLHKLILIAAARMALQLLLVGLILKAVFENINPLWLMLIAIIMLSAAARQVMRRQTRRFTGLWGFGAGALSMFLSSFSLVILSLFFIVQNDPWYQPQYAIPLLGMLLGNTMNGIALGLDRLTANTWIQRNTIESRLALGARWSDAISGIRRESIKSGMIPILNSMSVAGIVSLPGMMTGQILAGNPPVEAVKYQIMIFFLISAGTGFGTMAAVWLGARRLFDDRHRLRLDRLTFKHD